MEKSVYLDRTLAKYAGAFDIYRPYTIMNKEYPAYGYFFSCGEKYVLVKKANLWSIHAYEHVLFMETETCTDDLISEIKKIISDYMEPVLVRNNERYPEKDHMYSYLTVVMICDRRPSDEVIKKIKHFRFEKDYMFTVRGHSEGHLICADMESESVFTNSAARQMKKIYSATFNEVREGRLGYAEAFEKTEKSSAD